MIISFDNQLNIVGVGHIASTEQFLEVTDEVGMPFIHDPARAMKFRGARDLDGTLRLAKIERLVTEFKHAFDQFPFVPFDQVAWHTHIVVQMAQTELRLKMPSTEFDMILPFTFFACLDGDPDEFVNSYTISGDACSHNLLEFYPFKHLSFFGPTPITKCKFCWTFYEADAHI